ncbi:unnamed protein product, partial [Lymnaea stagnalis]
AIYSCHFLASWSSRMWSFSMGLFLASVSTESMQLSATYGLSRGAAILLLGAIIGDWVDQTPRLKAATLTMIGQNVLVLSCSCVILALTITVSQMDHVDTWLRYLLYAIIISLSVSSRLMKEARILVMERDWIVEMCDRDEHHLAVMTSSFRRIDLLTKMLAPVAIGHIMTYAGTSVGCVFVGVWSLLSLGAEYFLIRRAYAIVPTLRSKKHPRNAPVTPNLSDSNPIAPNTSDSTDKLHQDNSLRRAGFFFSSLRQRQPSKRRKARCHWWRMFGTFIALYRGLRIYVSYDVMLTGLALASLYLTVLGFDEVTIGYATAHGLKGSVLGTLMGTGAGFGILATFTYPFIVRRLGLANTGILALGLQVTCLSLCVISLWLPGSNFVPVSSSDVNNSSHFVNRSLSDRDALILPSNSNNISISGFIMANDEKTPDISIWVMIAGVVLARFGLWTADLTIIQLFLERVDTKERGIVNGVQGSLNQLMDFLKYGLVHFLPHIHQFGILVIISFGFICTGWTLMCVYAMK